jgi:hypothetical protein
MKYTVSTIRWVGSDETNRYCHYSANTFEYSGNYCQNGNYHLFQRLETLQLSNNLLIGFVYRRFFFEVRNGFLNSIYMRLRLQRVNMVNVVDVTVQHKVKQLYQYISVPAQIDSRKVKVRSVGINPRCADCFVRPTYFSDIPCRSCMLKIFTWCWETRFVNVVSIW